MDVVITTSAVRFTGAEDTAALTNDKNKAKAGTGVCTGVKGTLPTPPIPKTDIGISAETRCIVMEVGWSYSR